MQHINAETPMPWWRFGHVWLVISGPALVVVAGFVTLYLALSRPEHLVAEDYYQRGIDINKTRAVDPSMQPAIQGRNHAATGGPAVPAPASRQP